MGVIQRIFYFHVGSAWAGLTLSLCVSSRTCFMSGNVAPKYDWLGVSAAEVGLAFYHGSLITGPIWAHPVWGIWWTWDARLTSTFVLWLLYVSYLLLRTLDRGAGASGAAKFAIRDFCVFGRAAGVRGDPLVENPAPFSGDYGRRGFWPGAHDEDGLFFSAFAMHVLRFFLIVERYELEEKNGRRSGILQRERRSR